MKDKLLRNTAIGTLIGFIIVLIELWGVADGEFPTDAKHIWLMVLFPLVFAVIAFLGVYVAETVFKVKIFKS